MRMRISLGRPIWVACVGALASNACGSAEEFDESGEEGVAEVRQQLVVPVPDEEDTLAVYAARCDAATGIHVPAFSCSEGLANPAGDQFAWIDTKTSIDNVESTDAVGTSTGTRTPADVLITAKRMSSTGAGISGTLDHFQFASVFHDLTGNAQGGGGAAEVKIVNYESSSPGAVAGVMLRTDDDGNTSGDMLTSNAPHAFLSISPAGNVSFQYRATRGGPTSTPAVVAGQGFPLWLRLSWQWGAGTRAEISHDHESWQPVGTTAPIMGDTATVPFAYAGVAVAAATVNYDNFFTTAKCDTPSGLGDSCDLGSSFQVLARTADAIAVANCRQHVEIGDDRFGDVAVIQYNRKNGAVCFYQGALNNTNGVDGSWVPAPSDPAGTFPWLEPAETHSSLCTGCHDTGGLIRSPYLKQTGLLPAWNEGYNNDGGNKLSYVGHDFQDDRSYRVWAANAATDSGTNCGGCHIMAVNNVNPEGGTSMLFASQVTSPVQKPAGDSSAVHKNPVSATSPLWMRPNGASYPTVYDPGAAATAANFRECGAFLQRMNFDLDSNNWTEVPDPAWGCDFAPHGVPYGSPIQILEDTVWGNGGVSSGTLDNVSINSGPNTDIYGTSDTGVFAHTLVGVDGSAMVKVTSLTNTNEYAKAGLMFRADAPGNAANVMVALTALRGATFQYRPTAGAQTPLPAFLPSIANGPVWLRLDKTGETFVGLVSTDNRATWQQVGQAVTLPGYVGERVGLVNTAHTNSNQPGQAQFEAFDFTDGHGWAEPSDPHVLVDAKIGSNASGKRTEWRTREYITAGGSNGGGDIYGSADKFHYSFKTFAGDGDLQTTVESLTSTAQWGKAGLMMRDRAIDTSKNVFVGKTPSGVTFQYRNGTTTVYTNLTTPNQPTSFRLTRTGNTFRGYYKAQGAANWMLISSYTFSSFNPKALTGLAVSSETAGGLATAVFNSDRQVEPPGFVWLAGTPQPDPPAGHPCDGLCTGATSFTFGNNYQSGALGTGTICRETLDPVAGGNCSNVQSPRTFQINDVTKTCNAQNWSPPAPRNGGYCVELSSGNWPSAAFTLWRP